MFDTIMFRNPHWIKCYYVVTQAWHKSHRFLLWCAHFILHRTVSLAAFFVFVSLFVLFCADGFLFLQSLIPAFSDSGGQKLCTHTITIDMYFFLFLLCEWNLYNAVYVISVTIAVYSTKWKIQMWLLRKTVSAVKGFHMQNACTEWAMLLADNKCSRSTICAQSTSKYGQNSIFYWK